jgi:hypothetical protein
LRTLEKGVDSVLREAKADAAREYLKNTDSPSYSDYVKELESKNMEDQRSPGYFSINSGKLWLLNPRTLLHPNHL